MLARTHNSTSELIYGDTEPKTVKTSVIAAAKGKIDTDGIHADVGFFAATTRASDLVERISKEIKEVGMKIVQTLDQGDAYAMAQNFNLLNQQKKLLSFIEGDYFKKMVNGWAELGVYYLKEDETKPQDCVCILIENDKNNLPFKLEITQVTELETTSYRLDFSNIQKDCERIVKHNLTYVRHIQSLADEILTMTCKIHLSPSETRISLLNAFNKKWVGQLNSTYHIVGHTGTFTVIDASGKVIYNGRSNDINLSDRPSTTPVYLTSLTSAPLWLSIAAAATPAVIAYYAISTISKNKTVPYIGAIVSAAAGVYFTKRYYGHQETHENNEQNHSEQYKNQITLK